MKTLLLLLSLMPALGAAAQDWELAKEEDGIKVYTRAVENSPFDAVLAVMVIPVSADSFVNAFKHVDERPELFPNSISIEILDRPTDSTQIQYTHTDVPWPASDRDGIYHLSFRFDPLTGDYVITAYAIPQYIEEKEDIVRIPYSNSRWDVKKLSDTTSMVSYFVHVDPGGLVPEWLVNSTIQSMPIQTFRDLRAAFE